MAIEFNILGKWLNKNNDLSLDGTSIFLNNSPLIDLNRINDFLEFSPGFFGITLTVRMPQRTKRFKFLKKTEQNVAELNHINQLIQKSLEAQIEHLDRLTNKLAIQHYLRDSSEETLSEHLKTLNRVYQKSKNNWNQNLSSKTIETIENLLKLYPLKQTSKSLRKSYEERMLANRTAFYDNIESNPLTHEQRLAVIRENDRNLILAAAGTGKTSVMVAKALDLIDQNKAKPEEILVLAYNKAAAKELNERLHIRAENSSLSLDSFPEIMTFHAMGRKVLQTSGVSTSISYLAEDEVRLAMWVSEWITNYIQASPKKMQSFIRLSHQPMSPFDFESKKEYENYIRDNEFRTLKGELVKGYQELIISNWLYLNGVEYEYEPTYLSKRRLEIGFDYRPDFHILNTNLYIEHFGIDRKGHTRAGIDSTAYNEGIRNKRLLHQEFGTTLLETYHYDWVEQNLENRLETLLKSHNIRLEPLNLDDLLKDLKESGFIDEKAKLYLKSLKAIRVERLDKGSISRRLQAAQVVEYKLYSEFLGDLLEAYTGELEKQDSIDFDDMILKASQCIETKRFIPNWKYILVDEFQDISAARMELINRIINNSDNPILTVVGDDWQSIYRFSGGKLELTTQFEKRIGSCTMTKLQKTFRYNNSIANVAGRFVMKNPEQYRKDVITNTQVTSPQVFLLDDHIDNKKNLETKTQQVINKIKEQDPSASIAILSRYNYILRDIKNTVRSQNIKYWSFHGSKGLEADYCILVGFFQGKIGFPNENKEDAVVEALLPSLDSFPHSEERRLLYVAITRARKKSYIIADPTSPSEFVNEMIHEDYPIKISSKRFEEKHQKIFKCPVCEEGYFRLINGKHGNFYRCSSGLACPSKPRVCKKCGAPSIDGETCSDCQNIACGHSFKICPKCGRPLTLREGKFGKFWGCSGYGIKDDQCKYTEKHKE